MKSKLIALAISTALTISVGSATAGQAGLKKVWGGGDPKGSTYSGKYVPHLINVLDQNRMAGYEWAGLSDGTVFNAVKVTENPTHLAVGQYDILRRINGTPMLGENGQPRQDGATYQFTILHENAGPECLYAVTAQKGYSTWGHVLGNAWDLTVLTGSKLSGSYGTLQGLQQTFEELEEVEIAHVGGSLDIVKATKATPSSFGFFVMRPDPNSATFKYIADNDLTLVPVVDFMLEDQYELMDLKIAHGGLFSDAQFHATSCTSVAVITGSPDALPENASKRTKRRLAATIKRVGQLNAESLKPNLESWQDMWDSMKTVGAEKAKGLMQASKDALEALEKEAALSLKR